MCEPLIEVSANKRYLGHFSSKILILPLSLLAVVLLWITGVTASFDQSARHLRNQIYKTPASGDLVVLEMDAESLQQIGQWPWPRNIHASLVRELSDAGVSQIAFDVDFSSRSTPDADAAFSAAIEQSDANVILATFKQVGTTGSGKFRENLPLQEFAANAMLASVNVHPNSQGQIELYDYAEVTGHTVRPSMGALIVDRAGSTKRNFRIDQAIEPASVPRMSVVDVIEGNFDPKALKGKAVLVGASAIELGDRYNTAEHGIIPGVLIHALAAETLKSKRDMPLLDGPAVLLAVVLILVVGRIFIAARRRKTYDFCAPPLFAALLIAASYIVYSAGRLDMDVGMPLGFLLVYLLAATIIRNISSAYRASMSDRASGLPNMVILAQWAARRKQGRVAVIDISNFGEVKALSQASEIGPLMMRVAERLTFAAYGQRVFHVGNDRLAWIVPEDSSTGLEEYFSGILALFQSPFDVDGRKMRLQAHFGYAEGRSKDMAQLVSDAATAAHKTTAAGCRWMQFSDDMSAKANEQLTILTDIDAAIENADVWVAYQPKMHLSSGQVTSAEALARWVHPTLGDVSPDRFIPVLERDGRMAELTLHILRLSILDLERWSAGGFRLNCSVNISLPLFEDEGFVAEAMKLVSDSALQNDQITFEITETASSDNLEEAGRVLSNIRNTGIRISIDDYGTGQSTLSYLRGFPADEIKIDKVFVQSMLNNKADRVMVSSTIEMAHQMDFEVVAEGVESVATIELLRQSKCDLVQGWHIGKPVAADEFEALWLQSDDGRRLNTA